MTFLRESYYFGLHMLPLFLFFSFDNFFQVFFSLDKHFSLKTLKGGGGGGGGGP
jgi:hypothetical protein